jgi:Ca2+-binding EF-hand superfamily protein
MKKINYIAPFILISGILHMMISVSARAEEDTIKRLDQDQDGFITIKEAVVEPTLLATFGKIDTNHDGKISRVELDKVLAANEATVRPFKSQA